MNLAARGARNLDGGEEPIESPSELLQVRRQARKVYLESAAVAAALTILSLFYP